MRAIIKTAFILAIVINIKVAKTKASFFIIWVRLTNNLSNYNFNRLFY